jgi:FAD/FMN-containing dehydrogenase
VVIDVSPMNSVSVQDGVATVGAGARLGAVYDALDPHGVTIAAGCGPDVGIAGLTLGGGLGILGRRHGLTCDQLVAAEVVLADGRVVECDERRHDDLFWALRGAGGGQFGVVTTLKFRTVPAPRTTTMHLAWPLADAVAAIDTWQAWAPDAPEQVATSLLVTASAHPDRAPLVHVFGAVLDGEPVASALLARLVARVGAEPAWQALVEMPFRDAKRHLAEHGPGEEPATPATPSDALVKSEFFRRPLPVEAIEALVKNLADGRVPGQARTLDFSPWGGAYNRVPPEATAFPHRAERFLLKHDAVVDPGAPAPQRRAARDWLDRSWRILHPWGAGGVYPNFPDPELGDWATAYHGANYERLRTVKAIYDPDDVFHFHQSVAA